MEKDILERFLKIREKLHNLYKVWSYLHTLGYEEGYCKGSEGYMELRFPNYFEREESKVGVGIYSYVFGPHRMHDFESIEEAEEAVEEWEKEYKTSFEEDIDWDLIYKRALET